MNMQATRKGNRNKKDTYNQKETDEILGHEMKKDLENLTLI